MQTIYIAIAGSFAGGLLFITLQPALRRLAAKIIRHTHLLSKARKEFLLAYLTSPQESYVEGDWALMAVYAFSLALEIYSLYGGSVTSARLILVCMFLMLVIRTLEGAQKAESET